MSTANRKRRAMRRNPTRFLVDNIFAESPLQKAFRERFQKKNWLSTYGKKKREEERGVDMGFDFARPGSGITVETMVYVDHEGAHIIR